MITKHILRTSILATVLLLVPLSASAGGPNVTYSGNSHTGFQTYYENGQSGSRGLMNYNATYGANLKADAKANGNQYNCNDYGNCGSGFYTDSGSNSFQSHYLNNGYPDNFWGRASGSGSQFTQPTLNRLCYDLDPAYPDSTATGSGVFYDYNSGSADDNTLLYDGSRWYLLQNDSSYGFLSSNALHTVQQLLCSSYALPEQRLTASSYSVTAAQAAAGVTLTWNDAPMRDRVAVPDLAYHHEGYFTSVPNQCTSSGFSLGASNTFPACNRWDTRDVGPGCNQASALFGFLGLFAAGGNGGNGCTTQYFCAQPANLTQAVSSGSATVYPTAPSTTYTYTCTNPNGTTVASVTIDVGGGAPSATNGACASTHYNCSAGTPTSQSQGSSAYTWTCAGSNGGSNASCSEAIGASPINGACGSANNKTYTYGSSSYGSDTQCASGSSSNTAFPTAGSSVAWTCSGTNGGSVSGTCYASQSGATACILPWSGSIASGSSVTAYQSPTVTSPATCVSETRTCSNGSLSGSYTSQSCSVVVPAAPPTITSLYVLPAPVPLGTSPAITFTSANANYCYVNVDGTIGVALGYFTSGTFAGPTSLPPGTNNAEVICYNADWTLDTGWQSVNFTVTGSVTVNLSISSSAGPSPANNVPYGTAPAITIASTNGYYCYINMDENPTRWLYNGTAYTNGTFPGPTDLTLGSHFAWAICYNSTFTLDSGWQRVYFTVAAPPPTATLAVNGGSSATIIAGQSATLTWSSTNATSCTAVGGFSTSGATGNSSGVSISPSDTASYQIQCTGSGGSIYSNTVKVTVLQPNATITANPVRIPGLTGTTVITWSSANVVSCVETGPSGSIGTSLSNTAGVSQIINKRSVYTITCKNASGTVVATNSVTVNVSGSINQF